MDLAEALRPVLVTNGFTPVSDLLTSGTYEHTSGQRITLDPGTENWLAVWDTHQRVVCEARVTSPAHAIRVIQAFDMLTEIQVQE